MQNQKKALINKSDPFASSNVFSATERKLWMIPEVSGNCVSNLGSPELLNFVHCKAF
jgi:hypothetical protein